MKALNDWSDPDLVRNASARGHSLTKSNISRYRNENPLVSIKGSVIEALAAGLRVSVAQVATAAIESMGIALHAYEAPSIEQAIELDPALSERDRVVLLATLKGLRPNIRFRRAGTRLHSTRVGKAEAATPAAQGPTVDSEDQSAAQDGSDVSGRSTSSRPAEQAGTPGPNLDIERERQSDYDLAGGSNYDPPELTDREKQEKQWPEGGV